MPNARTSNRKAASRKQSPSARKRATNPLGNGLPTDALDPAVSDEINRLIRRFVTRILGLFLVLTIGVEAYIRLRHVPERSTPFLLAIATFGIVIPFLRGADRVFKRILAIGKERLDARRYRDAEYALAFFHRWGNMSFDAYGEGHYQLVRACLALGEVERARELGDWLLRHRKRFEWAEKAARLVEQAERRVAGSG